MYIVVRRDIPIADQVVQACHAAAMAGSAWGAEASEANFVLVTIENEEKLTQLCERLYSTDCSYINFYEEDPAVEGAGPMGYTAMVALAETDGHRRFFQGLPLWKPNRS